MFMRKDIQVKEERISSKEYIEFLKHMDLGFAVSEGTVRGKDSKAG